MSTWHQQQNKTPLWHKTKWSLVEDPPNQLMTIMTFDTWEQADEHRKRLKLEHAYILAPSGEKNGDQLLPRK